ncbi:polyprenol monophosphomannose synthase [Patescibacteria group bacterium]|nr:MAG: polyprenol monophosphomannose synthase [Patescibacteria group bacterium]
MLISLIIPTLNERGSMERLMAGLEKAAVELRPRYELEVIVVDDGSIDGTVEAVAAVTAPFPIRVIERKVRGLATAVLAGFVAAKGELLGVMDADLSHPPEMIPKLVGELEQADLVIGSRHLAGGAVEEWPWYRYVVSFLAMVLARPLARGVRDPLSGFFFLRRSVIEGFKFTPIGYKILLEILVKGRYQIAREIPYTFQNRGLGKSKMGLWEGCNFLRHLWRLYWWRVGG